MLIKVLSLTLILILSFTCKIGESAQEDMMDNNYPMIRVLVYDYKDEKLEKAKVILTPLADKNDKSLVAQYDAKWSAYVLTKLSIGSYSLRVEESGFLPEQREITVENGSGEEVVILRKNEEMPYYYRGHVRVPFEKLPEIVAISLDSTAKGAWKVLEDLLTKSGAKEEKIADAILTENIRVFRMPDAASAIKLLEQIRDSADLESNSVLAGQVLRLDGRGISFLTRDLIIKFKKDASLKDVENVVQEYKLEKLRRIPYASNAYVFRGRLGTYEILDVCNLLASKSAVIYAEPSVVMSATDDQVVAKDELFNKQWSLKQVGVPKAWNALHQSTAIATDVTFGSEEIIIAVMDRGIKSKTINGIARSTHPEFSGTLPTGPQKIANFFDFLRVVPNNDQVSSDHGMACAGVAAALVNNPDLGSRQHEGIAGVAGYSPLMGVIRPSGRPDVEYADAYLWIAGFDPQSNIPGFPAQLSKGAAVISNSFGGMQGPISGIMKDGFDYLTANGRAGRGTIIIFSVGNDNSSFGPLNRPWAYYDKTIAVAASTRAERHPSYSNAGNGIDVCAPSDDDNDNDGIVTSVRPGHGNTSGHRNGPKDYTNSFGKTSAAAPLVAGIAALILSACNQLDWTDVRAILRNTAKQIDFHPGNNNDSWVDLNGDGTREYSSWYGYGRVDAGRATETAKCMCVRN